MSVKQVGIKDGQCADSALHPRLCEDQKLTWVKKLTLKEAAEALRISVSGVRRLLRNGRLPSLKIGERMFLLEADIEAYLQGEYCIRTAADVDLKNENGLDPLPKDVADFVREELK